MKLKRPDLCIIVPDDARPLGWPDGWLFPPGPCPPGWPRSETEITRSVQLAFDGATLRCFNEHGEPDTSLDGEMILITAETPVKPIRVRINTESYSPSILVLIQNGRIDLSTLQVERKLAGSDRVTVTAQLYGYERKPETWVA